MILHWLLILSVFIGILLSVRYKRFRPFEAGILLVSIVIWSLYSGCPLTYLEDYLRNLAGYPLPIVKTGFISFYFNNWFGVSITDYQLTITTYITALVFLVISIEWLNPFVNFEIIKLRKSFGLIRKQCN